MANVTLWQVLLMANEIMASVIMANVTYGKRNYGKRIMASVTEPYKMT